MIWYTKAAQQYAVSLCCELPSTKVCVVVVDSYIRKTAIDDFVKLASERDEVTINEWSCHARILFSNGSEIYVIPPQESWRGLRMHLLIVDDQIDGIVLRDYFLHHEIPPLLQRPIEHNEQYSGGNGYDIKC